jgi:hypothetical protein
MTAITTAARLLRVAADELKNAHTLGGDWGNEHEALDAYNEHMATATTLEHMARQCLAQIEEPAQPVLYVSPGQLANHSNPEGPESEKAGRYLPARKTPAGKFTQPLYAGAAPAAVAPRARDLLGIVRTAQAEARRLINGEDSGSDLAQTKLDLPETLRVLEHALSQPAAVAGPANDLAELAMLNKLVELGTQAYGALAESNSDDGPAGTAAYVRWQERRAEMGELIRAHKAPALEAPAAPARIVADALIRLDAIYWEQAQADCDEPPKRPDWLVNALHLAAAAPQAPAAPYPPAFGPNDWVMSVAGTVVKLSEWEPGAVKARTIYGDAAPAAPAVDAELLELAQAIVKFNRENGSVLAVHIDNLADLVDERAAQAAAKGSDA